MGFFESISVCFSKFFDYNGRALRSEYWYYVLLASICNVAASFIEALLIFDTYMYEYGPISNTLALILLIPGINVCSRRLHDVGKSGWVILITLIPLIGSIWLLVLLVSGSSPGGNIYGEEPK